MIGNVTGQAFISELFQIVAALCCIERTGHTKTSAEYASLRTINNVPEFSSEMVSTLLSGRLLS